MKKLIKPIKKLSKTQILKIIGHGIFGVAAGALIASPFIWSTTSTQNKLPKAKLILTKIDASTTISMSFANYGNFLADIRDFQVKFTNSEQKEQILSLIGKVSWNDNNVELLENEAKLKINHGPLPTVGSDLGFTLIPSSNTPAQRLSFQASIWYHDDSDKITYTQTSNIVVYETK